MCHIYLSIYLSIYIYIYHLPAGPVCPLYPRLDGWATGAKRAQVIRQSQTYQRDGACEQGTCVTEHVSKALA